MELNDKMKAAFLAAGLDDSQLQNVSDYFDNQVSSLKAQVDGFNLQIINLTNQRDAAQAQLDSLTAVNDKVLVASVDDVAQAQLTLEV